MTNTNSRYWAVESTGINDVHVGFTAKGAGNLALQMLGEEPDATAVATVRDNRQQLEEKMGVDVGSTVFVRQTHSTTVVDASGLGWADTAEPPEADAIISVSGDQPLAIKVADCVPVVFASSSGATAVAHAGRVGLASGILQNTVQALKKVDSAATIHAWVGPAICGRCYEVPQELQATVGQELPEVALSTTRWNTHGLDLPEATQAVLQGLGVFVQMRGLCTFEDDQLFSHRRKPGEGRLVGVVWRRHDG